MRKVVGLGACVLDTIISCNVYPKEDTKQKADEIFQIGGGPVANALVVIGKLGVKAEVIGAFGSDSAADYILSDFKNYNVEINNAVKVDNTTSFTSYILLSEEKTTRTCVFDRGTVPDKEENVKLDALKDAYILHLDGNYLNSAIYAAKKAKELGVKVSLDAGGLYNGIEKLLPLVDILIPSAEFAIGFTGKTNVEDAMLELNARFNPEVLIVTDGSKGGYYFENGKALHYDSVKVRAVDTNGAGDTFHGAFIVAYCNDMSIKECCDFASKVAGYKCAFKGARTYPLDMDIAKKL